MRCHAMVRCHLRLIPSYGTTRVASLIPFQGIGQHTGLCTNTEIIGSDGAEYQAAAHFETVHVATDVDGCHRHFLRVEVVT